jgi:hypothetical protein
MLTNTEILSWAASTNFAYISVSPTCVIRPGRERWERRLQQLTPDERGLLIEKINRQQARLQRELAAQCGSNVPSQSVKRVAKEDSTPSAARRPAARRSDGRR